MYFFFGLKLLYVLHRLMIRLPQEIIGILTLKGCEREKRVKGFWIMN